MIVVLAKQASSAQIEAVAGRIRAEGLETRMLYGVEKTVIAVIGSRPPELLQQASVRFDAYVNGGDNHE